MSKDHWGERWSNMLFFPPCTMCQHPSCFEKEKGCRKVRTKGQYQLNKDKNCPYYKKKLYLFWSKDED